MKTLSKAIAAYISETKLKEAKDLKKSGKNFNPSYCMHVRYAYIARGEKIPHFIS